MKSADFFALNHYTTSFVTDNTGTPPSPENINGNVLTTYNYPNGSNIGNPGAPGWVNFLIYI